MKRFLVTYRGLDKFFRLAAEGELTISVDPTKTTVAPASAAAVTADQWARRHDRKYARSLARSIRTEAL